MYANDIETNGKQKLPEIKKLISSLDFLCYSIIKEHNEFRVDKGYFHELFKKNFKPFLRIKFKKNFKKWWNYTAVTIYYNYKVWFVSTVPAREDSQLYQPFFAELLLLTSQTTHK